jgi:hypothetical protein
VDLADLAAQAESADRGELVDPASLVDLGELVDPASRAAQAESADPGDPGALAAVSGSTDRNIEGMLPTQIKGRPTSLAVGRNNSPHAELLIGPLPKLVPAVELEPVDLEEVKSPLDRRVERRLALVAELAPSHPPAQQLPVVAGTALATAAYHRVPVTVLAVARLAAQRAATELVTTVVEAVIAWEVADIVAVAAVAAEADFTAEVVAVAEDAAEAEDVEDKGGLNDEETNENKNKYYDFAENFSGRFCDPYFLFVSDRSARCANGQNRCAGDIAANPKRIRHAKAGGR